MTNRNATPSINGWFFQISAGMFLFLRDIAHNKSLKIEGANEDIEIETDDGLVYAQAKCIYDINSRTTVYSHYKKALDSLKDNKDKSIKLVYISNIEDPFDDGEEKYYCIDSEFSFEQLKAKTQSKIRGILGDDFDYTKLDIIIKHFYGSEDNKKKMLLEQISKFLIESVGDDAYKNAVYNKIITDGLINASDRHYFTTKTKFVFNMVLPYLENVRITEEEIAGDPDSYDEAIENYQLFLGSLEADYGNISKILADYRMEKEKRSLSIPQYTIAFSERFIDLIPNNFSEQVRKELSRILVYRVLKQHHNLEKVKKVANIQ